VNGQESGALAVDANSNFLGSREIVSSDAEPSGKAVELQGRFHGRKKKRNGTKRNGTAQMRNARADGWRLLVRGGEGRFRKRERFLIFDFGFSIFDFGSEGLAQRRRGAEVDRGNPNSAFLRLCARRIEVERVVPNALGTLLT
jgi:hypothetical protein